MTLRSSIGLTVGFLMALCLLPVSSWAQDSSGWKFLLTAGAELRSEKSTDDYIENNVYQNFAIGGSRGDFIAFVEYASFKEDSGNATLSVDREFRNTLAWLLWQGPGFEYVVPYVGGGIGLSEEVITTTLGGSESKDSSDQLLMGGAAAGIRARIPAIWLSVEVRLMAGEQIDPQPALGALFKMGVFF